MLIVYKSASNKGEFNYLDIILSNKSKTVLLAFSFIDGYWLSLTIFVFYLFLNNLKLLIDF